LDEQSITKSGKVKDRLYLKYKDLIPAKRDRFISYRNKLQFRQIRRAGERAYYSDRIMNCGNDLFDYLHNFREYA